MDLPITKKTLFAQTRVQQALDAGAHYIDADDVREALDGFKGALDCQFGVHADLLARIKDLETQLFHYRVNAGGSEVLVGGTIKTRDRLVDYFRYVEESVPFAKTAETRERGAAIVDGMNWLIREAGNSRLAVQAAKAQRSQLEAELAEARLALDVSQGQVKQLALDVSQGQVKQLESEAAALREQNIAMAKLLKVWQPAGAPKSNARACPECQARNVKARMRDRQHERMMQKLGVPELLASVQGDEKHG